MKEISNPLFPFSVYMADPEAHCFDGRVYVYGGQDKPGSGTFNAEDPICWSAPENDLTDWQCMGVIYDRRKDPLNGAPYEGIIPPAEQEPGTAEHPRCLYSPSVVRGTDSRYYLYYHLEILNVISVAVSDRPEGPFEFYGYVLTPSGRVPEEGRKYQVCALHENGRTYLYYGFAPNLKFGPMVGKRYRGLMMVELADDMKTAVTEPVLIANGRDSCKGTSFEKYPFFEGAEVVSYKGRYLLTYSIADISTMHQEICYAEADHPEGPFTYRGVLLSYGDIGYHGNRQPDNYTGNIHGSLLFLEDKAYLFYHRHSHYDMFSRQTCAEELEMTPDGELLQAEFTSQGINGAPLLAKGRHDAVTACTMLGKDRTQTRIPYLGPVTGIRAIPKNMPYFIDEEIPEAKIPDCGILSKSEEAVKSKPSTLTMIRNFRDGAFCGFKYYRFDGTEKMLSILARGSGTFLMHIGGPDGPVVAKAVLDQNAEKKASDDKEDWNVIQTEFTPFKGVFSVYFSILNGTADFSAFSIS